MRLDYIESGLLALTLGRHSQQRPDGIGHPAAFPDHPAHIILRHDQFKPDALALARLMNLDLLRMLHEGFRDELD